MTTLQPQPQTTTSVRRFTLLGYVRRALENYRRGVWFDSFGWEDA